MNCEARREMYTVHALLILFSRSDIAESVGYER